MGLENLCQLISSSVKRNTTTPDNLVRRGQVTGKYITVAGKNYIYAPAVDVSMSDGDWVYVAISSGGRAVVVGK